RRILALQRLAVAREHLAAWAYATARPPEDEKDTTAFEADYARLGKALRETQEAPSPSALDDVRPAALRGMGEAALNQVRAYYDASLEYGRNTMAIFGFYYLGEAQAQKEFADLVRSYSAPSKLRA